jgi:hypothetical protein
MPSSGTTAITTSSDTAVEAIAAASIGPGHYWVYVVNAGANGGFISWDSANSVWYYMPANTGFIVPDADVSGAIQVKRIPSGSNLASVYVGAERLKR